MTTEHPAFRESEDRLRRQIDRFLKCKGSKTVREFHWELGHLLWNHVGMSRTGTGLEEAIDQHSRAAGGIPRECERARQRR